MFFITIFYLIETVCFMSAVSRLQSSRRSANRFIIYAKCLAMECVAAYRGRPNMQNYSAIKAGESGVVTEAGRKRDE